MAGLMITDTDTIILVVHACMHGWVVYVVPFPFDETMGVVHVGVNQRYIWTISNPERVRLTTKHTGHAMVQWSGKQNKRVTA